MADFITDEEMAELEKAGRVKKKTVGEMPEVKQAGPTTTTGEAIGRGLEEGASLGLAKGARAMSGAAFEALNPEPEQQNLSFIDRMSRAIEPEFESELKQLKRIEEEKPTAFNVARVVGSAVPLAPAFVTGSAPAIIGMGAGAGAVSSLAESENPLVGATTGIALSAVGLGAGKALQAVGKGLKSFARGPVLKALKLSKATLRRMKSRDSVLGEALELADDLIKTGAAKGGRTLKQFERRTAKVLKRTGEKLQEDYAKADKIAPKLGVDEVRAFVESAVGKSRKFGIKADTTRIMQELTGGLDDAFPSGQMAPSDLWGYIKHLDKMSRQYSRASDPTFLSKADDIVQVANSLRGSLIKQIESVNPELAKEITVNSGVFRHLATAWDSLSDEIVSGTGANKSLANKGLFETVNDMVFSTPVRLAGAGTARMAGGAAEALGFGLQGAGAVTGAQVAPRAGLAGTVGGSRGFQRSGRDF